MELYGHLGWSHGGARVITLMSPAGAGAVIDRLAGDDDVFLLFSGERQLPHYQLRRPGVIGRLAEAHGIVLLDFEAWTARKAELGEAIWK